METATEKTPSEEIIVIDLDDTDPRVQKKADTLFINHFVLTEDGDGRSKPYHSYDTPTGQPASCDGVFQHKRLTPHDAVQVGILKARMLGQTAVDWLTESIAEKLSYCQIALITTPVWWADYIEGTGLRAYDGAIIGKVYEHMRHWEDSFRHKALAERRRRAAGDSARTE